MREVAGETWAKAGRKLRIACTSRAGTAVSVWGSVGDCGPFPYVPVIPVALGKPEILSPLFKRFEGHHDFVIIPEKGMRIIVMQEGDSPQHLTETGLKVRFIHGRFGEIILSARRAFGDAIWAFRRRHAGKERHP